MIYRADFENRCSQDNRDVAECSIVAEKMFQLDGLKVEALGSCPLEDCILSVGTDDENYDGIWRGLVKK